VYQKAILFDGEESLMIVGYVVLPHRLPLCAWNLVCTIDIMGNLFTLHGGCRVFHYGRGFTVK